jgi:hypothetical protein
MGCLTRNLSLNIKVPIQSSAYQIESHRLLHQSLTPYSCLLHSFNIIIIDFAPLLNEIIPQIKLTTQLTRCILSTKNDKEKFVATMIITNNSRCHPHLYNYTTLQLVVNKIYQSTKNCMFTRISMIVFMVTRLISLFHNLLLTSHTSTHLITMWKIFVNTITVNFGPQNRILSSCHIQTPFVFGI